MNPYWELAVREAKELIASAAKTGHEYVGFQRARAIVEVDEELRQLRLLHPDAPKLHFGWTLENNPIWKEYANETP